MKQPCAGVGTDRPGGQGGPGPRSREEFPLALNPLISCIELSMLIILGMVHTLGYLSLTLLLFLLTCTLGPLSTYLIHSQPVCIMDHGR